jgi:hypothetical protein
MVDLPLQLSLPALCQHALALTGKRFRRLLFELVVPAMECVGCGKSPMRTTQPGHSIPY